MPIKITSRLEVNSSRLMDTFVHVSKQVSLRRRKHRVALYVSVIEGRLSVSLGHKGCYKKQDVLF